MLKKFRTNNFWLQDNLYREVAQRSLAKLAELLFITQEAVGKWERRESMPDIITFNRLSEILGVDLNYFSENAQSTTSEIAPVGSLAKHPEEFSSGKQKKRLSWDMSHGNCVGADFSGLKNLHEKFSSSNMHRCKFIGSDLSGLHLKGNNVYSCDFSGSSFDSSHIQGSNLVNNLFNDSSLKDSEFSASHIKDCDFSGADFTGTTTKSGAFVKNVMVNAVWNRTSLNAMYLAELVFEGRMEDLLF